jgi:hypothetical protein
LIGRPADRGRPGGRHFVEQAGLRTLRVTALTSILFAYNSSATLCLPLRRGISLLTNWGQRRRSAAMTVETSVLSVTCV